MPSKKSVLRDLAALLRVGVFCRICLYNSEFIAQTMMASQLGPEVAEKKKAQIMCFTGLYVLKILMLEYKM